MSKITILVGPPGSGKSTRAAGLVAEGYVHISQDTQGKKGHMDLFNESLADGSNIVLDRMNFSQEQRSRYTIPAKAKGYHVTTEVFHVPRTVCLARCMAREGHETINGFAIEDLPPSLSSPEERQERRAQSALSTFFSKYERVTDLEADVVIRHGWDSPTKKQIVVVDLDGTLCNIDHRLHYVNGAKKDWKNFNKEIPNDPVNAWCSDIINAYEVRHEEFGSPCPTIVFCSGRDDSNRKNTQNWLDKHLFGGIPLFMRPRDDFRQDSIIKEIILDFELKPKYDILFAIDDRQQVVDTWRKHGIVCLQCAPGNF